MIDERLKLTIQLERSGESLRISYYDAKLRRIGEGPIEVPWSRIGERFERATPDGSVRRGLDAITEILDPGDAHELVQRFTQSDLVELGHVLFYTLLGASERWEPVIRQLFDEHGDVRPNPPRRSVRVRIWTSVDALVDLPWRLAAWKGRFLVDSGWTFEVVSSAEHGPDIGFEAPCPLLVIAPMFAGMEDIGTEAHLVSLLCFHLFFQHLLL